MDKNENFGAIAASDNMVCKDCKYAKTDFKKYSCQKYKYKPNEIYFFDEPCKYFKAK